MNGPRRSVDCPLWTRRGGALLPDNLNAPPATATTGPDPKHRGEITPTIVYWPGVAWQAVQGTDHRLAVELARHHPVLWVDPPHSFWANLRRRSRPPQRSEVAAGVTRLCVTAPPGVTRPFVRGLAVAQVLHATRRYLAETNASPLAWVCSSTEPLLPRRGGRAAPRIYLATDDFVAGAAIWGMSPRYLNRAREWNLRHADIVLAVTAELAESLRRGETQPVVFPNGCDLHRFDGIAETAPAPGVDLSEPIAGVVGQFNERTDLATLEAVQRRGVSLLLVGPRYFASPEAAERFESLTQLAGVRWIDRVPSEAVAGYLRHLSVGLTPYADTTFNRRSYPLKTIEYLAAGLPVVSTAVPPLTGFDPGFVRAAAGPEAFAEAVAHVATTAYDPSAIRASVEPFDWKRRAETLLDLIQRWRP